MQQEEQELGLLDPNGERSKSSSDDLPRHRTSNDAIGSSRQLSTDLLPRLQRLGRWKLVLTLLSIICIGGALFGLSRDTSPALDVVHPHAAVPTPTHRSLEDRLARLQALPYLSQADIDLYNDPECSGKGFNRDYLSHKDVWSYYSDESVRDARTGLIEHLRTLQKEGVEVVWDKKNHGEQPEKGIVLAGGNEGTVKRLLLMLDWLRNHIKTDLPIELFSYADELKDEGDRASLQAFNVTLRKIDQGHHFWERDYSIKSKAFIQSSFQKFMYLDSDAIPLQRLDTYFDSYEMQTHGSAWYNDLYKDDGKNTIWRVLGKTCTGEHWAVESGQVLFDKAGNEGLNLAVLHLADKMLMDGDHFKDLSFGDKDTFRYGFYALDLPWSPAPRVYSPVGGYQDRDGVPTEDFHGHTLLNYALTPMGRQGDRTYEHLPGFLHFNTAKYYNHAAPEKFITTYQHAIKNFSWDKELVRVWYNLVWKDKVLRLDLLGPDGRASGTRGEWDGQAVLTESFEDFLKQTEDGGRTWVALQDLVVKMVSLDGVNY